MKRIHDGYLGMALISICALVAPSSRSGDVVWDGGGSDGYWTNALNWANNTLPSTADRAMIGLAGLPGDKRIRLPGVNQTVSALAINGDANSVIIGDRGDGSSLTLLSGNINGTNGTIKGVIAADVILGTNGIWSPPGSWGSTIFSYGDVTDGGNGYGVTFPNDQNRFMVLGGRWNIGGTLTFQNIQTTLGGVYTNEAGTAYYGGSITNAVGVYGDCRLAYSDGSDCTFIIANALAADSDRIQGGTRLGTARTGASFTLGGNAATAVAERVAMLDLQSGRMQLNVLGANKNTPTDLIATSVSRAPGTALLVTTNNAGRLFVDGAVNTNGTWQPWCFFGDYYSKAGPDQSVGSTAGADYAALASTGNGATGLYRFGDASLTLGATTSVWGLRWDGSVPQTLDLGPYDLTIGSGAMSLGAGTNRTITSSGGQLVFGGEDVILNVINTGTCTISAPLAWSKPAGSPMVRPSLVFVRGGRAGGGIVLDGEDRIGNYDSLGVYNTGRPSLVFAGPSNRTFHGPVNGLVTLEKRGSGVLTFAGADQRRAGTLVVTEGRIVLAHASAPRPTITNAVCEVAAGITYASAPITGPGVTFAGLGTFGATINPLAAHRIAPGTPTVAGCLTFGNQFAPVGDLGFDIKLDVATNDNVRIVNTFTKPPAGSTFTFRVTDLSNGTAEINDGSFVVLRYVGTLALSGNLLNLVVESGSPNRLDATNASALLNTTTRTIRMHYKIT